MFRPWVLLLVSVLVTGCNAPRGAGFQSEVLAASDEVGPDGEEIYDFGVYPITRDGLAAVARWPGTGKAGGGDWIPGGPAPANLLIAPGDVLQVAVWDAEDNSLLTTQGQRVAQLQDIQVAADGRIFVPFVGEIRVAGMAPATARKRIEEELVATVPSAQVQLNLAQGRSNTANLVSGVNGPGIYPLPDTNTTLLELIAQGGGVLASLENPQLRLFRGSQRYSISVDRLFKTPGLDTVLRGGDRIIIENEERRFLSLGATNRQSVHVFPDDHVTALDALAIIGGVADNRANAQGILVLREYPARAVRGDGVSGPSHPRMVFTIDLTSADGLFSAGQFHINDGDLVYATESPLGTARSIFGLIGTGVSVLNDL